MIERACEGRSSWHALSKEGLENMAELGALPSGTSFGFKCGK